MIPAQKIYLVGMSGSGKSTLGKLLADKLGVAFMDLDDEIEKQEQKSIPEIFEQHNENYFREIEKKKLIECTYSSIPLLLATGGGTPCFLKNMELMNDLGVTIFLDTPISEIATRLASTNLESRPLFRGLDNTQVLKKLRSQYSERLPFYRQAQFVFTSSTSVDEIVKSL